MWVIAILLVGALLITLTAIVVESPIGRSFAHRFDASTAERKGEAAQLERKVELLEAEVDDLQRSLEAMREEVQFVQRLLQNPARPKSGNS
jgi:cell division protein FtsB